MEQPSSYYDIMPIRDQHSNYYTGLYSSRENQKNYIRRAGQTLTAWNKLISMELMNEKMKPEKVQKYLNASMILTEAVAEA